MRGGGGAGAGARSTSITAGVCAPGAARHHSARQRQVRGVCLTVQGVAWLGTGAHVVLVVGLGQWCCCSWLLSQVVLLAACRYSSWSGQGGGAVLGWRVLLLLLLILQLLLPDATEACAAPYNPPHT
jgi:hypothetical protein